ncbi:GntR family transcriptional regulator [Aestuariivirga sp. YIM B02566]|uniref:GntR family transcriptional regulator n=1 Tax=Taklimakanibacter albus TaxID=2800327 RepID=A0ACC5RAK7_9HYPH|nr:GntR family transcriptional regulator [Aestuariivirga sp. YIM B02566]MBK1869668.1 GntR family transcriptional regulator [Aestuariivirga sp. YIM B02566]
MDTKISDVGTAATQAAREIRRRIISGAYPSGMRLHQENIAAELGVSRSPVREAFRQLEAEGLVILTSQKGGKVAPIRAEEVVELFELRLLIEPHLLALAVPNFTDADVAAAEKIIAEMDGIDVAQWAEANWRLHMAFYEPARRPTTTRQLERIHSGIDRYLRMQITLTEGRDRAHTDHKAILSACRNHDAELAVALLRSHILAAARAFVPAG